MRRRTRVDSAGNTDPRPLDPNSESESEPEEGACEADRIAYEDKGVVKVLSVEPCHDVARVEAVPMLHEDVDISDATSLQAEGNTRSFRACPHHAEVYELRRAERKCAKDGCWSTATCSKDGVRMCGAHGRGRGVQWRSVSPAPSASSTGKPAHQSHSRRRSRSQQRPPDPQELPPAVQSRKEHDGVWIAWLRDPEALGSAGASAYYGYPMRAARRGPGLLAE